MMEFNSFHLTSIYVLSYFSFDVRGRPLNDAQHWSAPETFGSRARFNAEVDPATLDIKVSSFCHIYDTKFFIRSSLT